MNEKNTELLFTKYPKLYADKDTPMTISLMCFGFECGDGWFDLINELSEKIETYNNTITENFCKAVQVKEKYGTLRFYVDNGTDEIYKWIDDAEKISEKTCETCGKPGKLITKGWWSVQCEDCLNTTKCRKDSHE